MLAKALAAGAHVAALHEHRETLEDLFLRDALGHQADGARKAG